MSAILSAASPFLTHAASTKRPFGEVQPETSKIDHFTLAKKEEPPVSVLPFEPKEPKPVSGTAIFGDLDENGTVDANDLNKMLSLWGTKGREGDLNRDGVVDDSDLNILLGNWGDVRGRVKNAYENKDFGDVDGNGTVDVNDLNHVLGTWGTNNEKTDINGDGTVDQKDLDLVLGYWGTNVTHMVASINKEIKLASLPPASDDVLSAAPVDGNEGADAAHRMRAYKILQDMNDKLEEAEAESIPGRRVA